AFPLFGVFAAAGGSWEKASKRRHQRKLETIRVKGEIKAAQAAARGGSGHPITQRVHGAAAGALGHSGDTARAASQAAHLERLFAEHDEITARWLDYELDVAKLIAFPAMSDGRQPLTAAFLRAKKTADQLRPAS